MDIDFFSRADRYFFQYIAIGYKEAQQSGDINTSNFVYVKRFFELFISFYVHS